MAGFVSFIASLAQVLSAPLAATTAIFIYLYFKERKAAQDASDGRLADAKASAADAKGNATELANAKASHAIAIEKMQTACEVVISKERMSRVEDARAYARELADERLARAHLADQFTQRILENQEETLKAASVFDSVLEVLGENDRTRRAGRTRPTT